MQVIVQLLFAFLSKASSPLAGYRTALGAVMSIAMAVYAVANGDSAMFALAVTQLLTIIGLKPDTTMPSQP